MTDRPTGLPEAPAPKRRPLAAAKVPSLIGSGLRVLELGAGSGELSNVLRERGCTVVGIEAGDLEVLDLDPDLAGRRFDAVVAVDVLHRLRDPVSAVARLAPLLAPGGYLVVSVPNVAHVSVRLAVLGGRFRYGDGPLDRDALRFFTRASLIETLTAGGFRAAHLEGLEADAEAPEVGLALDTAAREFVDGTVRDPDARAYEFLAVAYPEAVASPPAPTPLTDPSRASETTALPTGPAPPSSIFDEAQLLYVDLLKRVLSRHGFPQRQARARLPEEGMDPQVRETIAAWLDALELDIVHRTPPSEWPVDAETMLTPPRLDSLVSCVGSVVRDGVPGDLIETGVWRGGASILMRGVLRALGDRSRTVWVADSFQGLPPPQPDRYPADSGDLFWTVDALAVPLGEVMANFERYGLLDDHVRFLPGWFEDTLPSAPIERLAVLRLDGDMYASTMQALDALYPKLSVGGFAIVDDYGAVAGCRAAVSDYRTAHGITEPLVRTDYTEVLWRKER